MTVSSKVFDTIDAVVAAFETASLLTYDGPVVDHEFPDEAVFVGYDGDPEGEQIAADMSQEWAAIGAKRRNESFDIRCCAIAYFGDGDSWKDARARAKTLLSSVETVLRADPSLGQLDGVTPFFVAEIRPTVAHQENTDRGYRVRIPFTVHVETRI